VLKPSDFVYTNSKYGNFKFKNPTEKPKTADDDWMDVSESVQVLVDKAIKDLDEKDPYFTDYFGKKVMPKNDSNICKKFKMGKKLGEGGFGVVFEADGEPSLVIKTEHA
jgi:hypothetical protein